MRSSLLSIIILGPSLALQAFSVNLPTTPIGSVDLGFTEAAFDAATLQQLMSDKDCTGLRFYNVRLDSADQRGTVMAIGIKADGSEIAKGEAPYMASREIDGATVRMTPLAAAAAGAAVANMKAAGIAGCAAHFSKAEIAALLAMEGCDGIRVAPTDTAGKATMSITAVSIADGRMVPLGTGSDHVKSCADPCPTVCGAPEHYVGR